MQHYLSTGNFRQAYTYGKQSSEIISAFTLPFLRMELDSLLYEAALGVGDTLNALKFHRDYSENRERVFTINQNETLQEMKYKYALQQKNLQLENSALSLKNSNKTKLLLILFNLFILLIIIGNYSLQAIRKSYIRHLYRKEKQLETFLSEQSPHPVPHALLFEKKGVTQPVVAAFASGDHQESIRESRKQLFFDMLRLIEEEQLFLKPELNQKIIISQLGTNKKYLYEAIVQNSRLNFKQIINSYRVTEVKKIIESKALENPDDLPPNLYLEAGFNSPTSYYRAFRSFTGLTPKEYYQEFLKERSG